MGVVVTAFQKEQSVIFHVMKEWIDVGKVNGLIKDPKHVPDDPKAAFLKQRDVPRFRKCRLKNS